MAETIIVSVPPNNERVAIEIDTKEVRLNGLASICEKKLKKPLSDFVENVHCASFLKDTIALDLKQAKSLAEAGVLSGATIIFLPKAVKLRPPPNRVGKAGGGGAAADVSVDVDTAFVTLESAKGAKREGVLAFIDRSAKKVFESKGLLKASEASLLSVLPRDSLAIKEDVLFEAVVRWGKAQKGGDDLKKTLAKVLPLIRFPVMPSKDFAAKVVPLGLLDQSQTLELFTYIAQRDSGKGDPKLGASVAKMSTKKRSGNFSDILGEWQSDCPGNGSSYYNGKKWTISGTEQAIVALLDYTPYGSRTDGSLYKLIGTVIEPPPSGRDGIFIRLNDGQNDWDVTFIDSNSANVETWSSVRSGTTYNFTLKRPGK